MRFLRICGNAIEHVLDWVGGLPDFLASFLFAFTIMLGLCAGLAFLIGMGYVFFSMSPVAGWTWVVISICACSAFFFATLEEM